MKKLLIVLPVLMVMATAGTAQTAETIAESSVNGQKRTSVEKSWDFKDRTEEQVIPIVIAKGTKEFHVMAKSHLRSGELAFILVDPKGKTERAFSISADSDGKPGNGRATYEVTPALEGTWKIQIKTTGATGNFVYKYSY